MTSFFRQLSQFLLEPLEDFSRHSKIFPLIHFLCLWIQWDCKTNRLYNFGFIFVVFFDGIQAKVLTVFHHAVHSHLYSFALRFLFLQTHATSYSYYSSVTVTLKEKGGKPDRKPYPLPYGLRIHKYFKSENSKDYAKKPQRNCTFMTLTSGLLWTSGKV